MFLKHLFSTPVWADNLNSVSDNNLDLIRQFCLDQAASGLSLQHSNQGGYHSPAYSVEQLLATPLSSVVNPILEKVNECMSTLGTNKKLRLSSIWFHVNGAGHYNNVHSHGGVLSGAFYVSVPDRGSTIFFSRSLDMVNYFYGSIGCDNNNDLTASELDFTPSEKTLVIFPSWLPHGVRPNYSNKERISISFNTEIDQ